MDTLPRCFIDSLIFADAILFDLIVNVPKPDPENSSRLFPADGGRPVTDSAFNPVILSAALLNRVTTP